MDSNNVVTINFMFKLCVMNLNGLNVLSSLRIFIALKSISKILGWGWGCNPSGPNHAGATLLVAFPNNAGTTLRVTYAGGRAWGLVLMEFTLSH